jgi:hypothetical protein
MGEQLPSIKYSEKDTPAMVYAGFRLSDRMHLEKTRDGKKQKPLT